MKRIIIALAATLMAVAVVGSIAYAGQTETGNGAPSGAHYNLNIIGVDNPKNFVATDPFVDPNNGRRMFVKSDGGTKIMLKAAPAGESFDVLDYNGTDGTASFQLPMPGDCFATVDPLTGDVATPATCTVRYTVWIRALGKPTGSADMYTCASDPDLAGGYICSSPDWWVDVSRSANDKNTFTNVSKELLFLSADVDADLKTEHVQLFDPLFDSYYWQYDNSGLKLAQMRFYMGDYTITW